MSGQPARGYLGISEVLAELRADFPDISVSKIRFLETEGLIAPARSPAGYRRFCGPDLDRLRFILTAQRDQYLPLRVIRERLARLDQPAIGPARMAPAGADGGWMTPAADRGDARRTMAGADSGYAGLAGHGSAGHGSAGHLSAGHGSAGHGSAGQGSAGPAQRARLSLRPAPVAVTRQSLRPAQVPAARRRTRPARHSSVGATWWRRLA
jgi:DNA-binding transcriptional MerR regulator